MDRTGPFCLSNDSINLTAWDTTKTGGCMDDPGFLMYVTVTSTSTQKNIIKYYENGIYIGEVDLNIQIIGSGKIIWKIYSLYMNSADTMAFRWCYTPQAGAQTPYSIYDRGAAYQFIESGTVYGSDTCTYKTFRIKGKAVFSGPGVTDYHNGTGIFIPSQAGVGTHVITYSWDNEAGFTGSYTRTVEVYSPVSVNLGNDTTLCNGESILLNAGSSDYNYKWSDNSANSTLEVDHGGIFSVTVSDIIGCMNTDSITIREDTIHVDLGKNDTICQGATLMLDAGISPGSYTWNDNSHYKELTVSSEGIYSVSVIDKYGCTSFGSVKVDVDTNHVDLGANDTICEGAALVLDAGISPGLYTWNDNSHDRILTVNKEGAYSVTATDKNGCISYGSVTVNIDTVHVNLGMDNIICPGKSITLDALIYPAAYAWNDNSHNRELSVSKEGIYSVSVTDKNGCISCDSVKINVDTIHVNLGNNDSICRGSAITLDARIYPAAYSWNDNSHNKVLIVSKEGTYSVTVTDENNCISSDTIQVINYSLLKLFLGNDTTIDDDASIILHAGRGYKSYRWQDGTSDSDYKVVGRGTYWVSVTDSHGCQNGDTIDIKVTCFSKDVFIPDVFSPGSSKICNSFFILEGRCLGKAELTIFNRWGEKIYWNNYDFTSDERDIALCDDKSHTDVTGNHKLYHYQLWDGTDKRKGDIVSEGTYFFILTYRTSDDNSMNNITKKGSVTIVK
jgi:hypothetical protein